MFKKVFSIIPLLIFASCSNGTSSNTAKPNADPNYKPIVIAHRSASGYVPEHTLAALAMAHAFDVDYLEADIVLTKDDVLVVMHDNTLNTSTDVAKKFPDRKREDGNYYVIDFTLEEIKSLIVHERSKDDLSGPVFPDRFPYNDNVEFRIPTFEEFLITVQGMNKSRKKLIGIYPEVKNPAFHEKEGKDIVKITIDMLNKYGYNGTQNGNCVLQIFEYDAVKRARTELGWKGDLAMLVEDERLYTEEGIKDVSQYANIYAPSINALVKESSNEKGYEIVPILDIARKYNMRTCVWTYRIDQLPLPKKSSDENLSILFNELKVDEMFSDFPDVVIDYLKRNGMRN
ncbi:glycerophosphodiester phosphodiesterase [Brachyspira alvinipulli]|uniref:glycerophosphodiester phosphodiesterase n=1 Tax=Brachyspira alvinipulli TaxID=84379 RepID=UPI003007EE42